MTLLIPAPPVMADEPTSLPTVSKGGIWRDGDPVFGDAPSVLDTGHMPGLDTCGGPVDLGGWYHWHATATNVNAIFESEDVDAECLNAAQDQTAPFGYAFDGIAMFGPLNHDGSVPEDLDECGGQIGLAAVGGEPVYHYHSGTRFPNLPACRVGVAAQENFSANAAGGPGSAKGGGGAGGAPDVDTIAETHGVDAGLLRQVIEDAGGRNADLTALADKFGVSLDALEAVMPGPNRSVHSLHMQPSAGSSAISGGRHCTRDTRRGNQGPVLESGYCNSNSNPDPVTGPAARFDHERDSAAGTLHYPRCDLYCEAPGCVAVCPRGASCKRDEDRIVSVEPDTCFCCWLCSSACPDDAQEQDHGRGVKKKSTPATPGSAGNRLRQIRTLVLREVTIFWLHALSVRG